MSYKVNEQRIKTMLERIGEAAELVDDKRFLPFYRGIQIRLEKMGKPEEWAKMIAISKQKTNPSKYFAKLCKMIKAGTYIFTKATAVVKEVAAGMRLYIHDRIVGFGFGKYQKYWAYKAQEFINANGQVGFEELLEYAKRKKISQKYMATALKNCKAPGKYYTENVLGVAK